MIKTTTITNYLDDEYTAYAMYVIESRALSSVIDGLKPTQRKIIHIGNKIWRSGREKPLKIFQFGGRIASEAFYHHGDVGLYSGIINMAQQFKNNLPLLEEIGQFGSLRAPSAGAPRYISTKLHPNFRLLYKDFDLLTSKFEEGLEIEPEYFLPIVPTILINGCKGIAVGYAANILMRDPKDIIRQCINYIDDKPINSLKPKMNEFKGKFIHDKENPKKWYAVGTFKRVNTTTIHISELPPGITYEGWENILDKLVADKLIQSYEDNSKDRLDYTIKFTRHALSSLKDPEIIKMFKLSESFTEDYNTLDEYGKLKIFNSSLDILTYFVDFRLKYYLTRKEFLIKKFEDDIHVLKHRSKFIKAIVDDKLKINKRKRIQIEADLVKLKIEKHQDSYNYLLSMNIASLTFEKYQELQDHIKTKTNELKLIKRYIPEDMYKEDLTTLLKQL